MQVDKLLKDIGIDKERIRNSIRAILQLYGLKVKDISVTRKELAPSEIYVAAIEECNLEDAKEIMKQKYRNRLPAPITILEYKNKKVLFMGSARSVIFLLKNKLPDCIIVKIPDTIKEPVIVSEAKQTLKQIMEKQI